MMLHRANEYTDLYKQCDLCLREKLFILTRTRKRAPTAARISLRYAATRRSPACQTSCYQSGSLSRYCTIPPRPRCTSTSLLASSHEPDACNPAPAPHCLAGLPSVCLFHASYHFPCHANPHSIMYIGKLTFFLSFMYSA